jgi:hypothetical protein
LFDRKPPEVPPKPINQSTLVAQKTVVLPNSTRLVISVTDQLEKSSSIDKIQEPEIKVIDSQTTKDPETEKLQLFDSGSSDILSIKSLRETEVPIKPKEPPKIQKEKVKISPLNLKTIEEISEKTSVPSPPEFPKNLSLIDIFEKLDHLIESEIVELAKSRKKPGTELTQEITKNDDEFYDVLRGLVHNRQKFFQDQGNPNQYPENGPQNDKSTPTDKNSPDDNPLKPMKPPSKKTSDGPEIIDLHASPEREKDFPTPPKRKQILKVYKSVKRLEDEIDKQEGLLAKINRLLEYLIEHHYGNAENLVIGERHYLVASK